MNGLSVFCASTGFRKTVRRKVKERARRNQPLGTIHLNSEGFLSQAWGPLPNQEQKEESTRLFVVESPQKRKENDYVTNKHNKTTKEADV